MTTPEKPVHRTLCVGELKLHCVEAGCGEPVLLLPGWPQTWYAWCHVIPILTTAGRRVIVLDPRGLGESDKPACGYDLDTVAADVRGFVEQMGLTGPNGLDIVSHDVGSWIAYAFASAYPADVHRLVLSEMTVQRPDAARPLPDDKANIATWHFGFNRLVGLPEVLVDGRERLFLDWLFDNKSRYPGAIDEAAREHYARNFAAPGAAQAGFNYYRALLSPDGLRRTAERLQAPLTMPLLTIGAEDGVGTRLAESLRGAATDLHDVVLAGGHYLPEEVPEDFAKAVIHFWNGTKQV